jgi:cell division septation protein DedD
MTQTDGEKELVLGNKQLISLFFVVVALCGVFFAGGYMIGRNTSKTATANPDGNTPAVVSPGSQSAVPRSQDSEPPRETAGEEPQPPSPAPADSQSAPASPEVSTPSASTQTQAAHDTPAVPAALPGPSPATSPDSTGAIWLQVTALRRSDADNLVKTLREQNFPAVLADSSKPDLFRVLVGPYRQTADVADAKARLKSLGFANAFVQK